MYDLLVESVDNRVGEGNGVVAQADWVYGGGEGLDFFFAVGAAGVGE